MRVERDRGGERERKRDTERESNKKKVKYTKRKIYCCHKSIITIKKEMK